MNNPSWDIFRSKNLDHEMIFENDVARRLFCHEVGIDPSLLICPPNYAGIENVPIEVNDQWVAFQAKHSRDGKQNGNAFSTLRKVIKHVEAGDYHLDKIYCYSSGSAPSTPTSKTSEQQKLEVDLKAVGIEIEWFTSDRILTILEDTTSSILLRASQKFFESLKQPVLEQPEPSQDPQGFRRQHFSERLSEFVDREIELQLLQDFSGSSDLFSWWLVTGPSMSGKSRLTLEHCLSLSGVWGWGWLLKDELTSFDFSNWIPYINTFIVIDYAMGKEEAIEHLFAQLRQATSSKRFVHTVRVILLERQNLGWLRSLEYIETIGNWIVDRKFQSSPLKLKRLDNLVERATQQPGSIAFQSHNAAAEEMTNVDFEKLIRDRLTREEKNRWSGTSNIEHEALVFATMCGGFSISTLLRNLSIETQSYLTKFNCSEAVSKMVGVSHQNHTYPPLEPDAYGELMVLEYLSVLNPLEDNAALLFQRAADVDPVSFVNFAYRCGQSFSSHPSLKYLVSDWANDPAKADVYRAIFANLLDLPILSMSDRVAGYRTILEKLEPPSPNLFFLEKALFSKILALLPGNDLEIIPIEIQIKPIVQELNLQTNMPEQCAIDNLLDESYCTTVLQAWRTASYELQIDLLGPHLIEIFHNSILRELSTRPKDLSNLDALFNEVCSVLTSADHRRYCSTIYAFQNLCMNAIAGLVQFGLRTSKAMDLADGMRNSANKFTTLKRDGQWLVLSSSSLDKIELGLSILASQSRQRDYQYILDCLSHIQKRLTNEQSMAIYVQAAVQAAHGFTCQKEIDSALEVMTNAREYHARINTPKTASALAMIFGQLARETERHDLKLPAIEFLSEAAKIAQQYPQAEFEIVQNVIREICSQFEKSLRSGLIDEALEVLSIGLSVIQSAEHYPYEDNQLIHCGAFFESGFKAYVEDQVDTIAISTETAGRLANSSVIAWSQMIGYINPFGNYYSLAMQACNEQDTARATRCLEVLEIYASIDQAKHYNQIIQIIRDRLAEINKDH